MHRGGTLTVAHSSRAGPRPRVRVGVIRPITAGRVRGLCVKYRRRLTVELAIFLAASSIMTLMVMLGGEAVARMEPGIAMTLSDPDLERIRAASDALARSIEPNAPVVTPCFMSDGPDGIVEPCHR
jgi:hypothetical protein